MSVSKRFSSLLIVILGIIIPKSEQQQVTSHLLKVVSMGKTPSQTVTQFTVNSTSGAMTSDMMRRNAGGRFTSAVSVCATGMWAMYNSTNYGEGMETTTTVITMKATDITACTPQNSVPGLRSVQSVNFLGNPDPTMDGLDIYSEPYFLGGDWKITTFMASNMVPTGISGVRLGSLAITGNQMGAMPGFRLCGDLNCNQAVCIDISLYPSGLYFVRNTLTDTSVPWPRVIRLVQKVSSSDCRQDFNPPIPFKLRSLVGNVGLAILDVTSSDEFVNKN